jgi:hypothetical protein
MITKSDRENLDDEYYYPEEINPKEDMPKDIKIILLIGLSLSLIFYLWFFTVGINWLANL